MAINISQAFKRTSANPVDESLTLTKAQMLTVNDNLMPSKYFTVCQDDGKIYLYDKTNTVDPATGKFRVFEGGGSGGASNLADLEDVLLTTLADGQTLVWDDTEQKWVNADMPTVPTKVSELENDSKFVDEDALNDALEAKQDTLTEGDGIDITDDTISIDPMPAEDMDDVIDELPTGGNIAVTGYVPLGTLIPFYGETAPKFFLACDGSTYNKADYPELANHLLSLTNNTPYIVEGDNTKFKVPDLRGEFIRGTGTNSHTNQGSGENVGVHQDGTAHNNFIVSPTNNRLYGYSTTKTSNQQNLNKDTEIVGVGYVRADGEWTGVTDQTALYTSRPTNTSVLYCIAYKDIYSNPMNDYSTDEKVVGTWIDGKPLYQRTFVLDSQKTISTTEWTQVGINNSTLKAKYLISAMGVNTSGTVYPLLGAIVSSGTALGFLGARASGSAIVDYITIQYTKTTD